MTFMIAEPSYHPRIFQEISAPITPTFGVVKLDYDQYWPDSGMFHVSRRTRNNAPRIEDKLPPYTEGLPATARFMIDREVIMYHDIQAWMHGLCRDRCPEQTETQAKNSWRSLMADDRFTTNFSGSDTHADYINGTNLDAEPMRLQPMITGGAAVKITSDATIQGVACWEFEAIDCNDIYRNYSPWSHPWLFFQPTSSVRQEIRSAGGNWTGAWRENLSFPFPQYNEKSILPIFGVGMSYNYLPKWRIRILAAGEPFPSPFVY